MFKIEVTKADTSTVGYYWMNKHADDFAQFLPAQFTRELGELITKDNISIIRYDEALKDLLEGKISKHELNSIDCETAGKIRVCRHSEAKTDGGLTRLADYQALRASRETDMLGSEFPQSVDVPVTVQHDFGAGPEDAVDLTGHELALPYSSLELELTGLTIAWPYDSNGKFTGNN